MNRTILSALLASLILSATAMAQLAGTYTIDSSTPTGGGNYTSFIDAANALMAQGVSTTAPGDVTFVVIAGALQRHRRQQLDLHAGGQQLALHLPDGQ